MKRSKHDTLFVVYGVLLGSLSTLLFYQGVKNPEVDSELDFDDALVSGLGGVILGALPEALRLLQDNNPRYETISDLLKELRLTGLKVGTLMTLISVISNGWSELGLGARAEISIPVGLAEVVLSLAQNKRSIGNAKLRWALNGLVSAFSGFLTFLVSNKMFENLEKDDVNIASVLRMGLVVCASSLAAISNLMPVEEHAKALSRHSSSLAAKCYHRVSSFLNFIFGSSVWLGFMALNIQMQLITQAKQDTEFHFEDQMKFCYQ